MKPDSFFKEDCHVPTIVVSVPDLGMDYMGILKAFVGHHLSVPCH